MRLRLPAPFWMAMAGLTLAATVIPYGATGLKVQPLSPPARTAVPEVQPIYTLTAGIDGEIFPALANYASLQRSRDRQLGTVALTITNPGHRPLRIRASVQIPRWSDQEMLSAQVEPGSVQTLDFAPAFLPEFYRNREITAATAVVKVRDSASGRELFSAALPVRLRAAEDMYWGRQFRYASFIASWVTPHDPRVEAFLAEAKMYAPDRRLPGYESWKSTAEQVNSTYGQARAIYKAMQARGLSYVKSSMTLGRNVSVSERIRFPGESLEHVSANCIDAVVAYASVFENLGMDPEVVLVPGHAYLGVREAEKSERYLYIDVALTGRVSFEAAVLSASQGLRRYSAAQIMHISIAKARRQGIYPMPQWLLPDVNRLTQSATLSAPAQTAD